MQIHPSKWKFSAWDSENGIEKAIKEIQEMNEEVGHQPISLFALNKRFSEQLKEGLEDYANIKEDYYRSEDTIGVSRPERISIAEVWHTFQDLHAIHWLKESMISNARSDDLASTGYYEN